MIDDKFYITTAIDYPNGEPHLGHAFEKIVSDSYARWYKFLGQRVYFLTGTDENGQKLVESALENNCDTREFVDKNVEKFRQLCHDLEISQDDFIRTTEERHRKVATEFWKKLENNKDIYWGKYSGWYCLSCENFYTETQAPEHICPHHHTPLEKKEENGYFFQISKYFDFILDYIKNNPQFIVPSHHRKEILARFQQEPLKDIAFSRINNGWGIPVPGNDKFVLYTWCDALVNYYSALVDKKLEQDFWPANLHVIGKDIIWFHCVIWPCMLKALDIELPKQVYVHGMILDENGKKMSKSLNNVVSPSEIIAKYPVDSFRYYLLRAIPSHGDGSFSEKALIQRHNSELGNDLGNLVMRIVKLALKNNIDDLDAKGIKQELDVEDTLEKMKGAMDRREHNIALDCLWSFINQTNQYINKKEPWKLKGEPDLFRQVIYNCLYSIYCVSHLASPFLPNVSAQILGWIGHGRDCLVSQLCFGKRFQLIEPSVLFPKIED